MSEKLELEVNRHTARHKELLRRVPASVCNGSYQFSLAYKTDALAGTKLAAHTNPPYPALQQAVNQLETYGV